MSPTPHAQAAGDAPIACTLTPSEYRDRTGDLSALARRALIAREPLEQGERLTFIDEPGVEEDLAAAVDAEASCCSFLTMRLERRDTGLVLDVTGPAAARPIIAELFA
jgi:hypothetical protein